MNLGPGPYTPWDYIERDTEKRGSSEPFTCLEMLVVMNLRCYNERNEFIVAITCNTISHNTFLHLHKQITVVSSVSRSNEMAIRTNNTNTNKI